jgi:hypothetical protein
MSHPSDSDCIMYRSQSVIVNHLSKIIIRNGGDLRSISRHDQHEKTYSYETHLYILTLQVSSIPFRFPFPYTSPPILSYLGNH